MRYKMLIGGELVEGADTLSVINPATGAVFDTCPRADEDQLNQAVAAAKAAFPAWSAQPITVRKAAVEALADAVEARKDAFSRLLTLEQGKPLAHSLGEIMSACAGLRAFAGMELRTRVLRETSTAKIFEERTPLGVVAAITPWNFPLHLLALKIAPALLTGNTVVAKPAPTTPLTALLLGEVASKILPPGVLNVVVDANDLGAKLAEHPDVAKIAFTGSTATGRSVMKSASASLKRLTLELGGNDAAIVLGDADIGVVAPRLFAAAMANAGQVCLAVKRVYAHTSVYDQLCAAFVQLAGEVVVGDGLAQGTTMGPIQNRAQYDRVKGLIAEARVSGKVIAGGHALDGDGYFIAPTIVRDIDDTARLVREEQFGPVLPVLSFEDVDDAVARVNDCEYGLGGSVWTADVDRGIAIASRIQSGTVWVNKVLDVPYDVPYRGAKQSGMGAEYGQEGLEEYTQARIVNVAL